MANEQEPVRVRLYVETPTGSVDDAVEMDRTEWNTMTPKDRHGELVEMAVNHQNNVSPCGFEVLGTDAEANFDPKATNY